MSIKIKKAFISSTPFALHVFMRSNISSCSKKFEVSLITNSIGIEILDNLNVKLIPIAIKRNPSFLSDFLLFFELSYLLKAGKYNLIHSITPKAGFFSMIIGSLCGIPIRVHTFTGQVWVNKKGLKRLFLKFCDKVTVFFATDILVDSPSQLAFLMKERVLTNEKGRVINHGSICGVDTKRFRPNIAIRTLIRNQLGINKNDNVILFIGRLHTDKGILDLARAVLKIIPNYKNTILMIVGSEDGITFECIRNIFKDYPNHLRLQEQTETPENFMASSDILCLPSYREGFGQVIIEAASAGVPCVGSRIYGISDAIEEKKTGILFPAGDLIALEKSLLKLIKNKPLRMHMGEFARKRARKIFSSEEINKEMIDFYRNLI